MKILRFLSLASLGGGLAVGLTASLGVGLATLVLLCTRAPIESVTLVSSFDLAGYERAVREALIAYRRGAS